MASNTVIVGAKGANEGIAFANHLPLKIIAGPCAIESKAHALECAIALSEIAARLKVGLIFKSSFDKANRTSASSARGIGLNEALPILAEIKDQTGLPVVTDVHEAGQCAEVATVADILQIPAFLCRQTDFIHACAQSGRPVNIKKGQFLAPHDMVNVINKARAAAKEADMANVVNKVREAGNDQILITERGASFGYNTLVSDFRAIPIMAEKTGCPVVFDVTHSTQTPGGGGTTSGGEREFAPTLARAAVAVGVSAIFAETHPDPDKAPSDGPNMIRLQQFEPFVRDLLAIDAVAKARSSLHGYVS